MRIGSAACVVTALALAGFAYWGPYTVEGRHAYDEMDGIFPFGAAVLSALLFVVAVVLAWLGSRFRARRTG